MVIPFSWVFVYLWRVQSPTDKWRKIIAPHLLKAMLVRQGRSNWFNPISVSFLSLIFGTLAISGPTWKQQPSPFSEDIAALIIMLDVSSSMQQKDIQPSRLERAKQKELEKQRLAKEREEAKRKREQAEREAEEQLKREGKLDPSKSRFVRTIT